MLGVYLGCSSEVNDTIQLNIPAKLAVQPAVPVLVHRPLGLIQTLALIEVSCKDVSGRKEEFKTKPNHFWAKHSNSHTSCHLLNVLLNMNTWLYWWVAVLLLKILGDTCRCRWTARRTARDSQPLGASHWPTSSEPARGWCKRSSGTCRPTSPVSHTSSAARSPHSSETWSAPGT